ncbi:MAG: hypothetical protein JSW25_08215 [Thermoplasmata archaeon]|nr:MAG: hypothetical protein JSW25_08215 [Thermoplasmata archaeon]
MDWALILAVVAIIVSVLLTYWRTVSGRKQKEILEKQLTNQKEELMLLRQLVQSFNRLTESYDKELESMRSQLLLTSGESPEGAEPVDEATRAAEVEMEREKQKAEKKRQKEEAKAIKKMMKALEKEQKDSGG